MKDSFVVIIFYKFISIDDPEWLQKEQLALGRFLGLTGRMIIAEEGINATLEGPKEAIEEYKSSLKRDGRFTDIVFKESVGNGQAFPKLVIKVRPEIVTLGAGQFDIKNETAPVLPSEVLEDWYQQGEDFVVLDLRNDYEIDCGYFEKTVNPGLQNFRDLPQKLPELDHLKDKKVVAVCTAGIRCEKATCLLKKNGFNNIYQLEDGIHTYMKAYPNRHFKGTLFVFDNRITTPVVDENGREVVGRCFYCEKPTEKYANDDSVRPSKKVLCCEECFPEHQNVLRSIVS